MQITSISHSFSSQLVRSSIIEKYATASTTSVSLAYLVNLGNRKSLRESAVFLQQELPKRLARRVKAIQNLPFIVGVNPDINTVYQLYSKSFDVILNTQPISDTNSIQLFSETLENLTESHKDVVSLLASGFRECGKYMEKNDRHSFLDGMINARIGIRCINY